MYHPSRGGVRGGRDQFKWDDVKVDKHRENYLGHSVKAPVGRWQKGKDLNWYVRDKKSEMINADAAKEEIKRIKEEEEQAMREALGLAPKRSTRPQGNRLDKHEYAELIKRGSTAEDLGAGHAEAAQVQGLGLYKEPSSSAAKNLDRDMPEKESSPLPLPMPPKAGSDDEAGEESEERRKKKKRRHDERKDDDRRKEKHEKRRSHDSQDRHKHHKDKEKRRRHDSD